MSGGPHGVGTPVLTLRLIMKKSEIDINVIKEILESVPEDNEVISIDLTNNNYKVNVVFDYKEKSEEKYTVSLNELLQLIKDYENST